MSERQSDPVRDSDESAPVDSIGESPELATEWLRTRPQFCSTCGTYLPEGLPCVGCQPHRSTGPAMSDDDLRARYECYDGTYRFICEEGHTTVKYGADLDACTARAQTPEGPHGEPCGAAIEARVIPYEPLAVLPRYEQVGWRIPEGAFHDDEWVPHYLHDECEPVYRRIPTEGAQP